MRASIILGTLGFLLGTSAPLVSALETQTSTTNTVEPSDPEVNDQIHHNTTAPSQHEVEHTSPTVNTKLSGKSLQYCEAHQDAIRGFIAQVVERDQRHMAVYASTAIQVEAFYTREGKMLSTYSQLVANAQTQAVAAQNAVTAIKSQTFSCNANDPHGLVSGLKLTLSQGTAALQAYRLAVRKLALAVKSVDMPETTAPSVASPHEPLKATTRQKK